MRCRWLREDGTCALDGTRCVGACLYFESEEYSRQAAGGSDRDGKSEGEVWAIPAGVAAPFGLTEEAGGLDYHAGGGQTFEGSAGSRSGETVKSTG